MCVCLCLSVRAIDSDLSIAACYLSSPTARNITDTFRGCTGLGQFLIANVLIECRLLVASTSPHTTRHDLFFLSVEARVRCVSCINYVLQKVVELGRRSHIECLQPPDPGRRAEVSPAWESRDLPAYRNYDYKALNHLSRSWGLLQYNCYQEAKEYTIEFFRLPDFAGERSVMTLSVRARHAVRLSCLEEQGG